MRLLGDRTRACHCTRNHDPALRVKNSGPLLDRIDIHIEVPAVNYKELRGSDANAQSSAQIRERVIRARQVQLNRFSSAGERIYSNAQMGSRQGRSPLAEKMERFG